MDSGVRPSALDGAQHDQINVSGLSMHVARAPGPATATPVLLLHGFPQHWWQWRAVVSSLASDRTVLCADLRGCGWTDAPSGRYRVGVHVADVVGLLDTLGLPRVHVVAHDWGALVATHLALDHPERVQSLTSLGVPHPWLRFDPRLLALLRSAWFQPLVATAGLGPRLLRGRAQRLPRYLLTSFSADPAAIGPQDVETYVERLRHPDRARAGSAIYRDLVLPELVAILRGAYRGRRLSVPTVSIVGSGDVLGDERLLGGWQEHTDDFSLEVLDGIGHFVPEEAPLVVIDRCRTLFARTDAA